MGSSEALQDSSDSVETSGWDLFLCHTGVDKDWVRELATKLEHETIERRKVKVFFDEWEVRPGTNLVRNLENGLLRSKLVGVVLSPEMLAGEWPTMEWTIAVYQDPSGRMGKVLPILRRDCDIPPSLRIRNILDFRKPEKYARSYSRLLAVLRNAPLPRGSPSGIESTVPGGPEYYAKPLEFSEEVSEQIASNLFPVKAYPSMVWKAETSVQSLGEIYRHLEKFLVAETIPTFILKEKTLYCFWDLNDKTCPFRGIVSSGASIKQENTSAWIADETKLNWLLELLNRTTDHNCERLGLYRDRERHRVYFLPEKGHDRVIEWDTGKRKSRRTVVKRYQKGEHGDVFWAHQSARLRFITLDEHLFLRIEPGWTFTTDGVNPLPPNRMGSVSTKWMFDEYNPSIFYHLRFWVFTLSKGRKIITLDAGRSMVEVDATPATSEMKHGIEDDHLSIDKMYEVAETETPPVDYLLGTEKE